VSQHKNCESAVSQWLVDALSLGDERLIKAVLPLSGTPSKVEEYYLYKHIKSGNISALKALLENFPISLSSQSLRCFTSDNFVRENEAGLALREDVFSLLMEHDLDAVFARIARVRNHTSLPKVMKYTEIAKTPGELGFAALFLTHASQHLQLTASDIVSLVSMPSTPLTLSEIRTYENFYAEWLNKTAGRIREDGDISVKESALVSIVANLGSTTLYSICSLLISKCEKGNFQSENDVDIRSIYNIPLLRELIERHQDLRFIIEPQAYIHFETYLYEESAEDIAWLMCRAKGKIELVDVVNKLYSMAYQVSTNDKPLMGIERLTGLVEALGKQFSVEEKYTFMQLYASNIERNVAVEDGAKAANVLVAVGQAMLSCFDVKVPNFAPAIGLLAFIYADDINYYTEACGAEAVNYDNIHDPSNIMKNIGRSHSAQVRERLHSEHPDLLRVWRASLPHADKAEADVLKTILRRDLDVEEKSLLKIISVESILSHIANTRSTSQRDTLLSVNEWQGIEVIKMASEKGVKLSSDAKAYLIGTMA
jgi:hypothetical protein